jgi:hypothetical protein
LLLQRAAEESVYFRNKLLELCDSISDNNTLSTDDHVKIGHMVPASPAPSHQVGIEGQHHHDHDDTVMNELVGGSVNMNDNLSAGFRALESVYMQLQGMGYEAGVWDLMGTVVVSVGFCY